MKNLRFYLLLAGLLLSRGTAPVGAAPASSPAPASPTTETLNVGETKNHVETHAIAKVDSLDPALVGIILSSGKANEFQTYGIRGGGPTLVTVTFTDKTTKVYTVSVASDKP